MDQFCSSFLFIIHYIMYMKTCANCGNEIVSWVKPWQRCHTCGKEFCGYCADKLINESMRCRACCKSSIEVKSIM